MAETDTIKTFWEVINENQVEIPVIQRDYAQGRKNDRVDQIRQDIVRALVDSLSPDNENTLHLDFVYGRIQGRDKAAILAKNKEAIKNVLLAVKGYADNLNVKITYDLFDGGKDADNLSSQKLIPLDGQQRLTTLFLLHWYLLQRGAIPGKDIFLHVLKGFKYKTRKSTTEFCEYLTSSERLPAGLFLQGKAVSLQIAKSISFLKLWNNDPSVKGMLVMIDALHGALGGYDADALHVMWNRLTKGKMITFDFLDLDELEQTDELYVKMNARGKPLTDFEHFKAWLQEYVKKEQIAVAHGKWEDQVDSAWLDMFWRNRAANIYKVDDVIYNFIKNINLFAYIVVTDEGLVNKPMVDKIRETNPEKNFIAPRNFGSVQFFSAFSLDFLFTTFETLSSKNLAPFDRGLETVYCSPFGKNKLSLFFIKENQYPSLPDTVYYYAYLLFVNDPGAIESAEVLDQFRAWMRICRNLIYNTYIQNPDNLIKAVKSVAELAKRKFDIEQAIVSGELKINFFDSQAKEEKRKLEYFSDERWKAKILEYENHEYFYGQINFFFELLPDKQDFEMFTRNGDRLCKLFSLDIKDSTHVLQRALLAKGDYPIVLSGSKYSFCKPDNGSLRARNDNWRKVFDDKERRKILQLLLDDERELTEIIETDSGTDWRKFFTAYPKAISYCSNYCFDFANDNGLDIKLLKGTTYNGKHTDLYLYVLKLKLSDFSILKFKHEDINNYRTGSSYPKIEVSAAQGNFYLLINFSYNLELKTEGFEIRYEAQSHLALIEGIFKDFGSFKTGIKFKIVPEIAAMEATLDDIVSRLRQIDEQLKALA